MESEITRHSERLTEVETALDAFQSAVWKCVMALLSASGLALAHAMLGQLAR